MRTTLPALRLLFLCARNSCRSPMAESVARALGGSALRVSSAGLAPRRRVDPMALHVLRAAGYPVEGLASKGVSATAASRADLVVLLEGDSEVVGPLPPARALERWAVEDPLGWPVDVYEDALSDIEARVTDLLLRRSITVRDPWADARVQPAVPWQKPRLVEAAATL